MFEREIIDAEFEVVRPPRAAIRDTVYAAIAGVILGVTYFVVSLL